MWAFLASFLLAAFPADARSTAGTGDAEGPVLAGVASSGPHPWLPPSDLREVSSQLRTLYPPPSPGLLWFDGTVPSRAARGVLRALDAAPSLGLDPSDFARDRLAEALRAASEAGVPSRDRALLDVALSVEWMRFLSAVHGGLVRPGRAGREPDLPRRQLDLPALTRQAAGGADPLALVASVEPRHPGYQRLKPLLDRERRLTATTLPELAAPRRKVSPGDSWEGVPALRERLVALGELPGDTPPTSDPTRYDETVADAVTRFQAHHALEADGVLGRRTWAALVVPPARRVRQFELAMERWRWLPDPGPRVVVVLVPRAEVEAVDSKRGATVLHMRAIVGEPGRNATPVLAGRISEVVFRPYWIPPPRIRNEEILPKARAEPGWLEKRGLEIASGPGPAAEVFPPTDEALDRVARGELLLRQRPGPRNDLGVVKFVVPDSASIELHGTPHVKLFEQPLRDRSHGCIRLEDPDALARWVLDGEAGWNGERVEAAGRAETSTTVRLRDPVQVIAIYATASACPDGAACFVDDLYGLDARAEEELRRLRASRGAR